MKNIRSTRLSQAVRAAMLLAVLPAFAQAQDTPSTLDAVEVTGSRIRQTERVGANPVAVIDRAQIDRSGVASVGDLLLSRAADLSADLIVMGAYGHARLRQIVFGGTTRHMLHHMTVPVLMSH